MNQKKLILPLLQLIVSIIYLVGTLTFLQPCDPMEDGSFMSCHWAGQALIGISIVLVVQALILLLMKASAARSGVAAATIPVAILAMVIPGGLVHLCMMPEMHCRAVMRPGAICFGILIALLALINALLAAKKSSN